MSDYDADLLVVGGGPGGLATALHARRHGLSVIVAEPRPDPIDKACGEGLMPGGLAELASLGVDPAGMPFRGIAYVSEYNPGKSTVGPRRCFAAVRAGVCDAPRCTRRWRHEPKSKTPNGSGRR
jgi:flavin-dependent dehydrogenase